MDDRGPYLVSRLFYASAKFNMAAVIYCRIGTFVLLFVHFFVVLTQNSHDFQEFETITLGDVEEITKKSCILAFMPRLSDFAKHIGQTPTGGAFETFQALKAAFEQEPGVRIGVLEQNNVNSKDLLKTVKWKEKYSPNFVNDSLLFFPRRKLDRTCLNLKPKFVPTAEVVEGNMDAYLLLLYLNSKCQTFQTLDGKLSGQGRKRVDILRNLYHLPRRNPYPAIHTVCERIKMPSKEEFIHEYLYRSRPVVIEGALKDWPAFKKWTNEFLQAKFGKNEVHIKLTSDGIFEGCEKAEHFSNFKSFQIPDNVAKQLPFSDLVVVRPATMNLNFSSFMDMIRLPQEANISAYLEYSSIPDYMPELENDIKEFAFANILTRRHLNMWLSNGNTLGKLHFDPFENFLCQISGTKQITLFEPHNNTLLYEGHIQEAILNFDQNSKKFSRKALLDSTSMVMSPIDILQPDYHRFPRFKEVPALNCTIDEGDVLYMPSFWWHEVQSVASKEKRNLAVNFWYEPFLTKEFPCPECPMDINPHYYHTLL